MGSTQGELLLFADVDERARANLLLGNGFSIGVHPYFNYSSLRDVSLRERYLSEEDNSLFSAFETSDFELLMRRLNYATQVNEVLGIDHQTPKNRYDSVRKALVQSVRHVHPDYDDVAQAWLEAVAAELRTYSKVFTTNYDLILYWVMGSVEFEGFTDFFFSNTLKFDQFNVRKWNPPRVEVYYLHGALFIFRNGAEIYKIRRDSINRLQDFIRSEIGHRGNFPEFVSEGKSEDKLAAISRSSYLSFASRNFKDLSPGLTVYGSSLDQRTDGHILQSINNNRNLEVVAVWRWPITLDKVSRT